MATCKLKSNEPQFSLTLELAEACAIVEALFPLDEEETNPIHNDLHTFIHGPFETATGITLDLTMDQAVALQQALSDDESDDTDAAYWSLTVALEKALA